MRFVFPAHVIGETVLQLIKKKNKKKKKTDKQTNKNERKKVNNSKCEHPISFWYYCFPLVGFRASIERLVLQRKGRVAFLY